MTAAGPDVSVPDEHTTGHQRFAVGDSVAHPQLGRGIVTAVRDGDTYSLELVVPAGRSNFVDRTASTRLTRWTPPNPPRQWKVTQLPPVYSEAIGAAVDGLRFAHDRSVTNVGAPPNRAQRGEV